MLEAGSDTKFQLLTLFNIVGPFLGLTRNLGARHQVRVSGEESPPLSSTLENVEDFMVSTTTSETTIVVEGNGFEEVGIVDNPMCCVVKLVVVKRNETSKIIEENDI